MLLGGGAVWDWLVGRFVDLDEGGRQFDAAWGTETRWYDLGNYEPTPPSIVEAALDALPVDPSHWTFVDFGSGKGRVVLLASQRPFRGVVGIEHRPRLHAAAERNRDAFVRAGGARAPIHLFCADAAQQPLPEGPLVVWWFNPFGAEVVRPLLQRLEGRPVTLVYVVPTQSWLVRAAGFREVRRGGTEELQWRILVR